MRLRPAFVLLLVVACQRSAAPGWSDAQQKQYLFLGSGCFEVAHGIGVKDPEACCRLALPAAQRYFQSYGAWRAALAATMDARANYDVRRSQSAELQNWYVELSRCQPEK